MMEAEAMMKLVRGVKLLYVKSFEPLCDANSVNQLETDILLFLNNNPGKDTAQSICEFRGLSKSNVSGAVERLCARGWLERQRDEHNRRLIHLAITPAAASFVASAAQVQQTAFHQLAGALEPGEIAALRGILHKLGQRVSLLLSTQEEP